MCIIFANFFKILVKVLFATSETELDVKYETFCTQIALLIAGRLKIRLTKKLAYLEKISNLPGNTG